MIFSFEIGLIHIKAVLEGIAQVYTDYDYDDVIAVVSTSLSEGKCYLYWYELKGIRSGYKDFGIGPELIEIPIYGELLSGPIKRPVKEFYCKGENLSGYVSRFLPRPDVRYGLIIEQS